MLFFELVKQNLTVKNGRLRYCLGGFKLEILFFNQKLISQFVSIFLAEY